MSNEDWRVAGPHVGRRNADEDGRRPELVSQAGTHPKHLTTRQPHTLAVDPIQHGEEPPAEGKQRHAAASDDLQESSGSQANLGHLQDERHDRQRWDGRARMSPVQPSTEASQKEACTDPSKALPSLRGSPTSAYRALMARRTFAERRGRADSGWGHIHGVSHTAFVAPPALGLSQGRRGRRCRCPQQKAL